MLHLRKESCKLHVSKQAQNAGSWATYWTTACDDRSISGTGTQTQKKAMAEDKQMLAHMATLEELSSISPFL